jgi:hypothetical protein
MPTDLLAYIALVLITASLIRRIGRAVAEHEYQQRRAGRASPTSSPGLTGGRRSPSVTAPVVGSVTPS